VHRNKTHYHKVRCTLHTTHLAGVAVVCVVLCAGHRIEVKHRRLHRQTVIHRGLGFVSLPLLRNARARVCEYIYIRIVTKTMLAIIHTHECMHIYMHKQYTHTHR
jgi:predicted lysophospholipase L1 biosynthesis ABC-type transport system permease subunit